MSIRISNKTILAIEAYPAYTTALIMVSAIHTYGYTHAVVNKKKPCRV